MRSSSEHAIGYDCSLHAQICKRISASNNPDQNGSIFPSKLHHLHSSPSGQPITFNMQHDETLTQKSRRRENADVAVALLKAAIIKACYEKRWRWSSFTAIRWPSSDVDFDLERLEESPFSTEAEQAIYRETRSKVRDVRAYLEGRPTDLSSLDDLDWVKRLKNVFESPIGQDKKAEVASTVQREEAGTKPALSKGNEDDGFESQKVYGGSGGGQKK